MHVPCPLVEMYKLRIELNRKTPSIKWKFDTRTSSDIVVRAHQGIEPGTSHA